MAVTVTELIDSRQTSKQAGEVGTLRVFQVTTTQDLALDVAEVPRLGEQLSWDPTQRVTFLTAEREPGSYMVSRVNVRYSSSGQWGGINPNDPDFKSWTLSYSRVAQQIPYAIKDPNTFRYVENNTTKFVISYPIRMESHWEARGKFVRRLRIRGWNTQNMAELVRKTTNRLHKIYGVWYMFNFGDVSEVSYNTWDVTYTWEYDPGTPDVFTDTASVAFPHVLTPGWISNPVFYPDVTMARPPYHQIATIPVANPTTNQPFWPIFEAVCMYDHSNPIGYQVLPGFTL